MAPVRPAGGRTLHSRSELFRGHVGCRLSLQGTLRGPETEGVWAWMRQTLPAILALGLWPHSWSSWSFCSLIPYPQLMQSMDEDSFWQRTRKQVGSGLWKQGCIGGVGRFPEVHSNVCSLLCDLGHDIHLLWNLVSLWKSNQPVYALLPESLVSCVLLVGLG